MEVNIKVLVLRDVSPFSLVDMYLCCRVTCCLSFRVGLKWRQQIAVNWYISTQYFIPEDFNLGWSLIWHFYWCDLDQNNCCHMSSGAACIVYIISWNGVVSEMKYRNIITAEWEGHLLWIFEVLSSNLGLEASYPACWTRVRLSGFVLRPLISSSEVGGICTRFAQKVLKPLIYFSQNPRKCVQFFR